jgi:hypothetical protein
LCLFIANVVETQKIIPENTPHSISAGIVYFVCQKCSLNISKKSISSLVIGDEEFAKLKPGLLEKAQYSKFTQNEALAKILLLTGDALINIFKPGKGGGSYPDFELMKLRRMLSNPKEAKLKETKGKEIK